MIRRLYVLFTLALACPVTSWAATNSLREGKWGLEFQVQAPLFSSGYTGAAGIGAIRHFSDRSAVRFGVMVGINSQDTEGIRNQDTAFPDTTVHADVQIPSYSDHRDVSAFIHLTHYVAVGTRLGMLLEGGPSARWISDEYGRTEAYLGPYGTYFYAADQDSWSYGGDLQLGFQWFFRSRLSLAGRYGITAQRTESKGTNQFDYYSGDDVYGGSIHDRRFDDFHSNGFTVQTTPAVISLIAYF